MIGVSRIRPTSFVHLAALLFVHVVEKSARYVQNCHGFCVMFATRTSPVIHSRRRTFVKTTKTR